MSLVSIARKTWRTVTPEPLRAAAAPTLDKALKAYVRASAARPHGSDNTEGPLRVVGYFSGAHGIAGSAKLAARALEALGCPVERLDAAHARLGWTPRAAPLGPACAWIIHLNAPELLAELAALGPSRLVGPRYAVWAWELPKAPVGWKKDARLVDEVWAPSRFTAEALSDVGAPVRVVPHPLFMEDYASVRPAAREAAFEAVALFDFNSSAARKNPMGAIAAFRRAFGEDPSARLTIKTQNGALFPGALEALRREAPANVRIVDETWPYEQVKSLIASADVLVSLHRAEGFGLTLAEAMAMGTPVIATGYSGNLDFMDESNSRLVPFREIPVEDPQGIYKGQTWADPDLDAAAQALQRLRADEALRRSLSSAGRAAIAAKLSPQAWFAALPDPVQAATRRLAAAPA